MPPRKRIVRTTPKKEAPPKENVPSSILDVLDAKFTLTAHKSENVGSFIQWRRRLAVHMAYHEGPMNVFIHLVWGFLTTWSVLVVLTHFKTGFLFSRSDGYFLDMISIPPVMEVDGALCVVLFLGFLMGACDFTTAILLSVINAFLWLSACEFAESYGPVMALSAAGLVFLSGFIVPVFVGHGVFEKDGIDDSQLNFQEFFATWNPVYLMMLLFYVPFRIVLSAGIHLPEVKASVDRMQAEIRAEVEKEYAAKKAQ